MGTELDNGTSTTGTPDVYEHKNDTMGLNDAIKQTLQGEKPAAEPDGPVKPNDLPDSFWDAEKGLVKVDELITAHNEAEKRAKGLRDKLAKGENLAPKDVAGYELAAPEGFEFTADDEQVVGLLKEIGVKHKLSQEQLQGVLNDFMTGAQALGFEAGAELTPEEIAAQQQAYVQEEYKKIGPNASVMAQAVAGWGKVLESKGIISSEETKTFENMINDAPTLVLMNKLRSLAGFGDDIPGNTGSVYDSGILSDDEIHELFGKYYKDKNDTASYQKALTALKAREAAGITGPLRTSRL